MKYLITTFIICLLVSCIKEKYTSYESYLINKSGHTIEIRPYVNGAISVVNIIRLQINDSFKIADGSHRGLVDEGSGFSSKYFAGVQDSIRVIFDNNYSTSHYVKTPISLAPKYYLYTSLRNLGNIKAFAATSQDISKTARYIEYKYTFTEQDYLDAK